MSSSRCRKPTEVGKLVKLYREQRHLSQIGLGRKMSCTPSYISRVELGDRPAHKRETIEDACRALELGPEQRDRLIVAGGYAPLWTTDITVRQLVFLLRNLPTRRERKLRRAIRQLTEDTCRCDG